MYVEYQIPQNVRHPYPIVLVHGGGLTGTYMMGTPDGREGWNTFFLRRGYAVYVPTRQGAENRPTTPMSYGPTSARQRARDTTTLHRVSTLQPMAQCASALAVARLRAHRRSHLRQFYASEVEGMASATNQQGTMQAALAALLDRSGPAIVLTHSQSGPYGWLIADARPSLVRAWSRSSRRALRIPA